MDDLAKIQMFLSEYINPEAEVTWEYGVDEQLKKQPNAPDFGTWIGFFC